MKIIGYLSLIYICLISACSTHEYKEQNNKSGHYFIFSNTSSFQIDSIDIKIGDKHTRIHKNNANLSGSVIVPDNGYPHHVAIRLHGGRESYTVDADSFNYYKCTGVHEYILSNDSAQYVFHP